MNKETPGRRPACESCGKARKAGQLGQVWGTLQEGRSEGRAFGLPNRLDPKPFCRGQAWQLRAGCDCPQGRTEAPKHPDPSHRTPHCPSPHTPHHAPPWLLTPPLFPSSLIRFPALVCRGPGPTGHSPQSTHRAAKDDDRPPDAPEWAHPELLLAAVLAPPVPAERTALPAPLGPAAFQRGPKTAFMKEEAPTTAHVHARAHTHTEGQSRLRRPGSGTHLCLQSWLRPAGYRVLSPKETGRPKGQVPLCERRGRCPEP